MSNAKAVKPSALFANFATDRNLEKTGITLELGMIERDGKSVPMNIRIARAGGANTRFDKVLEHKTKPYKRMIQADTLDVETSKRIMRETFQETVILGWDNIPNLDGEFLDFTPDNVLYILEQLPDLFIEIQTQANKQSLFRIVVAEEDAKN